MKMMSDPTNAKIPADLVSAAIDAAERRAENIADVPLTALACSRHP
jgi:hypothetical protein